MEKICSPAILNKIKKLYSSDPETIKKIEEFLNTKTLYAYLKKIDEDPTIPEEKKEELKRQLLTHREYIEKGDISTLGKIFGFSTGALAGYLLSGSIKSPLLRGATIGTSGLLSYLLANYLLKPKITKYPFNIRGY